MRKEKNIKESMWGRSHYYYDMIDKEMDAYNDSS